MASKKYAYYNKGNKVALVQQDTTDITNSDYARYKSPTESITQGVELEYSYTPTYKNTSTGLLDTDKWARFQCWGAVGGYLTIFASPTNLNDMTGLDLTSKFTAGDWIEIQGSGRWSGIHKVKSRSADGTLQLDTLIGADNLPNVSCNTNVTDSSLWAGAAAGDQAAINSFKASIDAMNLENIYVWLDDVVLDGSIENDGLYRTDPTADWPSGQLSATARIYSNAGLEVVDESSATEARMGDTVNIYLVFKEAMTVYKGIDVLEDEIFDIDLNNFQSNAIVLFLKARNAEDQGDLERHEYYMAQFRKQLGRFRGAQKYGPYMVQGNRNMLK